MRISDWSSDVCSSDLKAVAQPLAARLEGEEGNRGDGGEPECPARGRADRAVDAAAEELVGRVERRDGSAVGNLDSGAAKDQEDAQGDPEGRHADVGHPKAQKIGRAQVRNPVTKT